MLLLLPTSYKKLLFLLLILCACAFLFYSITRQSIPSQIIAITQIADHESLDKVRTGIIDGLKKQAKQHYKIVYQSAQGNPVLAMQIAKQFVAMQPKMIIAISTPSAQATAAAIKNSNIPLIFASVTNPVDAHLVTNLRKPSSNITGTINYTPMMDVLHLIRKISPSIKKIGVIINTAEANSNHLLKSLTSAAHKFNVSVVQSSVTAVSEVQLATVQLTSRVDAIVLLQDNTVASALPTVLHTANAAKIPVFSTYIEAVKRGALAGVAFDEYAVGLQTAEIANAVLNNRTIQQIPVAYPRTLLSALNKTSAKRLNVNFSASLITQANFIYE